MSGISNKRPTQLNTAIVNFITRAYDQGVSMENIIKMTNITTAQYVDVIYKKQILEKKS